MSSRKSSSPEEGLPSSKHGERTPLRSLENEMLHLPTSSRLKSGADAAKMAKDDVPLHDPVSHLDFSPSIKMMQMYNPTIAKTVCGLVDITFKSFVCPGGEVEMSDSSVSAEQSIVLPQDQATCNTGSEDTVISDSMIVQSCADHTDHPYYNSETTNATLHETEEARLGEFPNTTLASGRQDEECATQKSEVFDNDNYADEDIAQKHDTVPLPQAQDIQFLQDNSVNSTYSSHYGQLCEPEHADHPSCSSVSVPHITTFSEAPNIFEKCADGLSDVTFKSFSCSGGEVDISERTNIMNDTVPVPDITMTSSEPYSYSMNQSILANDYDVQNGNRHVDHPYCYHESSSLTSGDKEESLPCIISVVDEVKTGDGDEKSSCSPLPEKIHPQSACVTQELFLCEEQIHEAPNCHVENDEVVLDCQSPAINTSSKPLDNESVTCQEQETVKHSICSENVASAENLAPVEVQQLLEHVSQVQSSSAPPESSEAKDSALGSSGNEPVLGNSAEKPHHPTENPADILKALSEFSSVASALQFRILSPVVRRSSKSVFKALDDHAVDNYLAFDSALDGEKSLVSPVLADPSGLWVEHLESPMPRPLFNSTVLCHKPHSGPGTEPEKGVGEKPYVVPPSEGEKPAVPLILDGPLQQQLRQMAEFLLLATGKMVPGGVSVSAPPPAATMAPPPRAPCAESHSVCVGTSAVKLVDHSINTSGQFELKRDFSVADSCAQTDPLLWNVPPGSLECLPRSELEQRLRSSMIMVEALVQQLAASPTHGSTGPAPSELREKLVQTDHTELSQTTGYRDLYMEALSRISELELDGGSLQKLIQCMQDMRITMTSLSSNTDTAFTNMIEMEELVREDHQSLVSHYGQMKSLFEKTRTTQTQMMQKVKEALHQRDDMRKQMEESFQAKEAAFRTMEQLRTHCATEKSELERSVGSQQELLAALKQTFPEQVALNQAYTEMLNSASDQLSETMVEQSSLIKELGTVRALLQKTAPMLLKLNDKAVAALRERDEHISAKDQAVNEREQFKEELDQTYLNLQTAREQIGDLNLQMTILSSEMNVLHEKLTERDQERGQLERKATELSATVSSTLASYTFLEQALAAETTKLQQSWKDIQQARDRGNELEASLEQSEQQVSELSQALSHSEEQLSQLQTLSQSQKMQIQQLQDLCTQLSDVREMSEFLQMENQLAREQVSESERLLRSNLQGLRERNIQCEDLKEELSQLQLENRSLREQLETTRSQACAKQVELGEKLAQRDTEITLLHHTLRGLTNELQAALNDERAEQQKDKDSQSVHQMQRRHPSSSFVDSIMVALTAEQEEEMKADTTPEPDTPEAQSETLFSEKSAFTRIAAVTPKKNVNAAEIEPVEDDESGVAELVVDVSSTVAELISTLKVLQQRRDAQLEELHNTIYGLQEEQQTVKSKHEAEVSELKHQLNRLNVLAERGNQALQQQAQDEKTVVNLSEEIQEVQEILNKHKFDNNELRKEVTDLRLTLQQSKVESQFLREELRKAGGVSANPTHLMEEKILLLKEVARLKLSLQEVEQAKVKLLERAKRHQMIHQNNQQKSENELQMLNHMINKVRETLMSLPEIVKNCELLQQLVEYIG
ncbi:sperm-associated antigen 5 [Solea solea]|uniref:sperm-associated antigen 5 n=1 Tax=Solea solea TaxID=90069 RepID=UPI00272C6826|nr:sperm-associated antigen 5 [Solea solea]